VDPGDRILLPDKLWGNYRLIYEVRLEAEIATFPFYAGGGFDVDGFAAGLAREAEGREKLIVLLNFPNNPTGYMPTVAEGEAMAAALVAQAERGTKLVVVTDDAYFGLFYHLGGESMTESLFGRLVGAHPNLLAVKLDGATKELFVWGLRCGFLTFGPGRAESAEEVCAALEAKTKGAIRGAISNSPKISQSVVAKALASASIDEERKAKAETLRVRAQKVHDVAGQPRYRESFEVYPFNSGYFMCVKVAGVEAEQVRLRLLDEYQAGVIATSPTDLRIAFSCLEVDEVEPLFELIHRAIQELRED
jgi:aspartate/methionine/tyrosine aminotransferase